MRPANRVVSVHGSSMMTRSSRQVSKDSTPHNDQSQGLARYSACPNRYRSNQAIASRTAVARFSSPSSPCPAPANTINLRGTSSRSNASSIHWPCFAGTRLSFSPANTSEGASSAVTCSSGEFCFASSTDRSSAGKLRKVVKKNSKVAQKEEQGEKVHKVKLR